MGAPVGKVTLKLGNRRGEFGHTSGQLRFEEILCENEQEIGEDIPGHRDMNALPGDVVDIVMEQDEDGGGLNRFEMGKMGFYSEYKWVGPIIHVRSWRDQNYHQLGDEYMDRLLPKIDACMVSRALQINAAIADELITVCDPKHLACPAQPKVTIERLNKDIRLGQLDSMINSKGVGLNTLKMRRHRFEKNQNLTKDDDFTPFKFFSTQIDKEGHKIGAKSKKDREKEDTMKGERVTGPETVLTIAVIRVDSPYPDVFRGKISHEIEVLSKQKLSDLRDYFPCSMDKTHFGEFSAKLNSYHRAPTYRKKFPSATFFVEDTFYDDLREPEAIRMSDTIVQWSESRDRGWHGLKQCVTPMHLVTFEDLTLQLGKPYLYLHQGSCEHVWMVTSLRLYHPHDLPFYRDYPRTTGVGYFHRKKCMACMQYVASWMLANDDLLPRSPAFMCDRCVREFHYDFKGKKIHRFTAYHFVDPNRTNIT